jgi:hypothetical protein
MRRLGRTSVEVYKRKELDTSMLVSLYFVAKTKEGRSPLLFVENDRNWMSLKPREIRKSYKGRMG